MIDNIVARAQPIAKKQTNDGTSKDYVWTLAIEIGWYVLQEKTLPLGVVIESKVRHID